MRRESLLRAGGWAAVIAGALRVAASFTSSLGSELERQSLYFLIDLLLMVAVLGAYVEEHDVVGGWGAAGCLTTLVGILLVRSSRALPGLDLYPAGAAAVAVGWAVLELASWWAGKASVLVPLLFVLSIATAVVGQVVGYAQAASVASGAVFGAAMVAAGRKILTAIEGR
jgi:hypothetical protein